MGRPAVLKVDIVSDFVDKGARSAMDKFDAVAKRAAIAGTAVAAGAAVAVKAAEAEATANARLDQVLSNMGVGDATDRVLEYADSLAQATGVNDSAIKEGQALLATFSAVADSAGEQGGAFDRATAAAVDLAAAGYRDVTSNAKGLGKALQDPIKGMAALTEAGTLTAAEQKAIGEEFERTGDLAAAQASILDAVEKQVGGVAEATANDTDRMAYAWSEVTEAVGMGLLPYLGTLTTALTGLAAFVERNSGAVMALGAAIGVVAGAIVAANVAIKAYLAIMRVWAALTKVWAGIQIALNVAMMLNPIGLVVLAVVALIAVIVGVVAVFKRLYDRNEAFRAAVDRVWGAIKAAWQAGVAVIRSAWDGVVTFFRTKVKLIRVAWSQAVREIKSAWDGFTSAFKRAGDAIRTAAASVVDRVKALWEGAKTKVGNVADSIRSKFATAWQGVRDKVDTVVTAVRGRIDDVISKVQAVKDKVEDYIKAPFIAAKDAILEGLQWVIDKIEALIGWIGNIKWPSPPKWLQNITGSGEPAPSLAPFTASAGGGGYSAAPVVINVNGALDPDAVARQLRRLLLTHDRRTGAAFLVG